MQRIGKNIFSLGAARITSGLITFFVYIKLVTYLGPDDFGRFSLVLAFYTIFLLFIDLGMSRYVIKRVSEDTTRADRYLGNFLLLQFVLAGVIFVVFAALPHLLGYDRLVGDAMVLAGVGLFLAAVALPFAAVLQAVQKIHLVALVYFLHSLINAAWMVFAIYTGRGLVFVFWAYIIFGVVDLLLYLLLTRKVALPKMRLDRKLIKNMFILGLPFALISAFEIAVQKIDVIIQKVYLPFAEVGFYSSAYRFLDFLTFLPAVVAISLFPYFSGQSDLNEEEPLSTINNLNRYMWVLALPLGMFSTVLGRDIILALFDERYLASVLPFQILIWATALTLIYAVPNVMMIVKQTKKTMFLLLGVVALNVLLNFWFIPRYGIVASAWITVVSYLITAAFYIYYTKQLVRYQFFSYAWWPLISALVASFLLRELRELNFVVAGLLASVLYFFLLFGFGFLKKDDLLFLKSIFKTTPTPDLGEGE